jgi:hypothetical protein
MEMNTRIAGLASLALAGAAASTASGAVVTLTPDQINGGDTNTAMFDNGEVMLTPFIGASQATFNGGSARLGIDDQGTNANAFNDPDTDPNNGNEEMLVFNFVPTSGLTQLSWDFSRASGDGMTGGVAISGFLADPLASFAGRSSDPDGAVPDLNASYDSVTGTLFFQIPFEIGFANEDGILNLANAAASAGAELTLKVFDEDQAGAQLAITSISYENAIPAPASLALVGLGGLVLARRRR